MKTYTFQEAVLELLYLGKLSKEPQFYATALDREDELKYGFYLRVPNTDCTLKQTDGVAKPGIYYLITPEDFFRQYVIKPFNPDVA